MDKINYKWSGSQKTSAGASRVLSNRGKMLATKALDIVNQKEFHEFFPELMEFAAAHGWRQAEMVVFSVSILGQIDAQNFEAELRNSLPKN